MKDLPCEFEQLERQLKTVDRAILYGAHRIAEDTLEILRYYGWKKKVSGFAVTVSAGNPSKIQGLPVRNFIEYTKDNQNQQAMLIIIAMPEKFFDEVAEYVKGYGYDRIYCVGGKQLAYWENQDTIRQLHDKCPQLHAMQDEYEHLCIRLMKEGHRYKFMPLGTFPLSHRCIENFNREDDLWEKCGNPIELTERSDLLGKLKSESIQIYAASSPKDSSLEENCPFAEWEIPVIGGAALTNLKNRVQCDNEGIHISSKNQSYAEMTVAYWAWKNSRAKYIGVEHYRRRYVLSVGQIEYAMKQDIDVIMTRPRIIQPNIREWFPRVSSLSVQDIDLLAEWLKSRQTEDSKEIDAFFCGNILYPNNMVIAKRDVYGKYCEWLFSILFALDEDEKFSSVRTKSRYDAYMAEMLTSLYFLLNRDRYHIAITDYRLLA